MTIYHEIASTQPNRVPRVDEFVIQATELPVGHQPAKLVVDRKRNIVHISPRERRPGIMVYRIPMA